MQIFLIGLTGGVGTAFAEMALAAGHSVVALVRDEKRVKAAPSPLLSLVTGDITKMGVEALATALRGTDVVVAAYGVSRTGGPATDHVHENGVTALVAAMPLAGVSRLVYLGENDAHCGVPLAAARVCRLATPRP